MKYFSFYFFHKICYWLESYNCEHKHDLLYLVFYCSPPRPPLSIGEFHCELRWRLFGQGRWSVHPPSPNQVPYPKATASHLLGNWYSLSLKSRKDSIFLRSILSLTKTTRGRPIGGFVIHDRCILDLDLGFREVYITKSSVSYIYVLEIELKYESSYNSLICWCILCV